jgi:histidine triad (HIT) family protein
MHQEENCIFCKIIKKEISCHQIYEDDKFLAFLDIKPVSDGHVLVIPKEHIVWMQEADDETISGIFKLAKKIMIAMKKNMECDFVQESVVGEEVPHFHIHLIPRYLDDNFPKLPTKTYKNGQQEELVQKITKEL